MDESGPRLIYHNQLKNKKKSNTEVSHYHKEHSVLFCKKYLMFLPISLITQLYVASTQSGINKETKIFYAINRTNGF